MKKVLLLMAMLTIGLASINAQDNLRWGATVGMNSSNFSITGFDSKIGFHAGVKAEVGLPQISEGVYLDMGALLTLKGAKIDEALLLLSSSIPTTWKFLYTLAINMQ